MATLSLKPLQAVWPRAVLRRGSFGAHVLTMTTGTGLAQGVTFVATLVLARLLVPADFGILALFVAITSVLAALGSWRYETAIMLPERHEDAANLQALAFIILVGMCSLALVGIAVFRHKVARLLGAESFASVLWGVPVSLFFVGVSQIVATWCSRMKQFSRLAASSVSQSLGTFASQLGLVLAGVRGPEALVVGWIGGQAVGTLVLGMPSIREYGELWRKSWNGASIRAGLVKYRNFPLYNAPYLVAQTLADQVILLVLRILGSLHVVGLFAMARRVVFAPASLLGSSTQQVFYEKAATELKSGRLEPAVLKILTLEVALGAPLLVAFVFEAPTVFRWMLGPAWAEMGVYAALLAVLGYFYASTAWMERIFDVQGQQRTALICELVRDAVLIGGLAAAFILTHDPIRSIGIYVGLDLLCALGWLLVAFNVAHFAAKNLWRIGGLFLSTAAASAVVLWTVHSLFRAP